MRAVSAAVATSMFGSSLVLALAGQVWAAVRGAQGVHRPGQHAHDHDPSRGTHGNPRDLEAYVARMEDPSRAEWQKPDEVVKALGLAAGRTVCDIGAGPGYFSLRLADAVTPAGLVYAVDVEPQILAVLAQRVASAGARNVVPVLGLPADPLLPPAACDLILIVDTYHHFPDAPAYLRRLARSLKPGGRIANVDFHKRPTEVGPPVEHRVSREHFVRDAELAGLVVEAEHTFLLHQYFLVLRPKER